MSKFDHISKGTEIPTWRSILRVTDYNGSIVYLDELDEDEDGNEVKISEERMTLAEIGELMKIWDGKNHRVIFDD